MSAPRGALLFPVMRPRRPSLSLAIVGDNAIFLDRGRNRYFALMSEDTRVVHRLLRGESIDERSRLMLAETIGVEADERGLRALITPRSMPIAMWDGAWYGAIASWRCRTSLLIRRLTISLTLRTLGLDAALRQVRGVFGHRNAGSAGLASVIAASVWLDGHLSSTDACLARSLSLTGLARSRGCDVTAIIGVKVDPFEAHCWAQCGDRLLNDSLDRVAAFTPILAIP